MVVIGCIYGTGCSIKHALPIIASINFYSFDLCRKMKAEQKTKQQTKTQMATKSGMQIARLAKKGSPEMADSLVRLINAPPFFYGEEIAKTRF